MYVYLAIVARKLLGRSFRRLLPHLLRRLLRRLFRRLFYGPFRRMLRSLPHSLLGRLLHSLFRSQLLSLQSPLRSQAFSLRAFLFTRKCLVNLGWLSGPFAFPDALWPRSSSSSDGSSSGLRLTSASRGGFSNKGTWVFRGVFGRVFCNFFGVSLGYWHPGPLPEGVGFVLC